MPARAPAEEEEALLLDQDDESRRGKRGSAGHVTGTKSSRRQANRILRWSTGVKTEKIVPRCYEAR